jgi:TolB-like protein/class 3 adenylate cyclase/Tfp pilus assembly protein PilF
MVGAQDRIERRLAAIFAADVAGYSHLMGQDEVGTLRTLTAHREVMDRLIAEHGGTIANTAGDGILASFPSAVDAVQCAVDVQKALAGLNIDVDPDRALRFRIGIHVGDVMVRGGDLLGAGVNIAARLEGFAEPGGVCLSQEAHHYVCKAVPFTFIDLGLQKAKNMEGGIWAFAVEMSHPSTPTASKHGRVQAAKPSVAVLPFDNLSGLSEDAYFSDGITDEIITGLARFRTLFVVARNSSFSFRGKPIELAEIGQRLGVSYLVQGSVRRGGDRVRIAAQLVEAATGAHLWVERYDRPLDDLLAVQDEVTQMIASTLFGRIEDATLQQAIRKQTDSAAAYDLVLRGFAHFRGYAEDDNQRACEMFERAVAVDPQYGLAQAYLAFVQVVLAGYASASPRTLDVSLARATRAVDLDPQESRCRRMLAMICLFRRDYDAAERHFQRALEQNPNDADGTQQLGFLLALRGRSEEALRYMAAARRLNPFHPTWYNHSLGIALYSLRQYGEAAQAFRQLPNPGPWSRARLAACYAQAGRSEEAEAQRAAILKQRPDFSTARFLHHDVLLERAEDREHLRDGLLRAGLPE